mgnify:CR=1 FL=1
MRLRQDATLAAPEVEDLEHAADEIAVGDEGVLGRPDDPHAAEHRVFDDVRIVRAERQAGEHPKTLREKPAAEIDDEPPNDDVILAQRFFVACSEPGRSDAKDESVRQYN